jgi:hypothetical protein
MLIYWAVQDVPWPVEDGYVWTYWQLSILVSSFARQAALTAVLQHCWQALLVWHTSFTRGTNNRLGKQQHRRVPSISGCWGGPRDDHTLQDPTPESGIKSGIMMAVKVAHDMLCQSFGSGQQCVTLCVAVLTGGSPPSSPAQSQASPGMAETANPSSGSTVGNDLAWPMPMPTMAWHVRRVDSMSHRRKWRCRTAAASA